MLSTAHKQLLKMKANMGIVNPLCIELITVNCKLTTAFTAAADTNCTAVVSAEQSAAFLQFQRHYASVPPDKNVNSADDSLTSAVQFSGNIATNAAIANLLQHLQHFVRL